MGERLKVIVFAGTKGGVGKTTLAFSVAIEAAKLHPVLVADLDPQQSLAELFDRRRELINPLLVKNVETVSSAVRVLTETGYAREFLIVDTPGVHMSVIRDAIAMADCVVLPFQPSPLDLLAQEPAEDLIDRLGQHDRTLFVLNRCDDRAKLTRETTALLKAKSRHPLVKVGHRTDFARAWLSARTGAELNKAAAREIAELWKAIRRICHEDRS